MKRFLLSLVCCTPLLFNQSISFAVDLTGPSDETFLSFEQYGPVSPVETLWAISSKLRPDNSVSVQQTMVALYKSNPYAFYEGNINKIIPESILKVPSLEFVAQQTDREAMALIKKYSPAKKTAVTKTNPTPVVNEVEKTVETKPVEPASVNVDPAIIAENELNKEKAASAQAKLSELEAELALLNEQFIVATEATQALKLKLQPLNDEIVLLNEQLEQETAVQEKLQAIIDDYRTQLDAIEPAPFSGEGFLNEVLSTITSSLTNLLIVIISPLLLLLLTFVVISRIRTKREIALQEQELAESTATLMEESGQFDALLTDDFDAQEEPEVDFTVDDSEAQSEPVETNDEELTLPVEEPTIDLSDDDASVVDLTEDDDITTSEDDPFGIGSLTEDDELISSVDLDDEELQTSEDDPFGIGALTEEEDEVFSGAVDLDESEIEPEDDPFGIGALSEEDESETQEPAISEAEQADLDLAAEWESQVAAESDNDLLKSDDVVDESESIEDLAATSEQTTLDELDIDSALSETELSDLDSLEEGVSLDVDAIVSDIDDEIAQAEEIDKESEVIAEASQPDVFEEETSDVPSEELAELDLSELEKDISQLETVPEQTLDQLAELEDDITALDSDQAKETDVASDDAVTDLQDVLPADDTENEEMLAELDLADLENSLSSTELEKDSTFDLSEDDANEDVLPDLDGLADLDLTDLEQDLDESDAQALISEEEKNDADNTEVVDENDLLAQQISDVAFNNDVPLPKVGDADQDDFIDIETLLEGSGSTDSDEPYSELNLELGLEEFPDVVDLQSSVDIDDDENGIGAQLDLARAYLEIDDKAGAKEILQSVLEGSNGKQRDEINKLLSRLN
ncbi:FimV/HubP family polar landmark protein [Psychromonas sp. psych-6C06]|uniref:FimV/HubP family polar landmark protein n=1 Tax=Psychromonas sp. psych-6C06 TaxID=2058089 RepID=UPI00187C0F90|nr:FimV/HubP family polar landmark protein [Psychromonas sp. psych-6C06]